MKSSKKRVLSFQMILILLLSIFNVNITRSEWNNSNTNENFNNETISAIVAPIARTEEQLEKTKQQIETIINNNIKTYLTKEQLSEWEAISIHLSGYKVAASYFEEMKNQIKENEDTLNITDYEKIALLLKLTNKNPDDYFNKDITQHIFNNPNLDRQGVNGFIFALIIQDDEETSNKWNKENLIKQILTYQNENGGFCLAKGMEPNVDITAQALAALSPYSDDTIINSAITKGLMYIAKTQEPDGTFIFNNEKTSESVSQIIIALTQLGIDPENVVLTKNNDTLIDTLMKFKLKDDTFSHIKNNTSNNIATEQATLALISYHRFLNKNAGIYGKTQKSYTPQETKSSEMEQRMVRLLTILQHFNDIGLASEWAKGYIIKAQRLGIIVGDASGNVNPKNFFPHD